MPKLLEEFPPIPTTEWDKTVHADLKGASYDEKLLWHTDDGILVKPFYRSEDLPLATVTANSPLATRHSPLPPHIDAARFEESGATTTQELAFALAEGIEFVASNNPPHVTFSFAIGSSYFFEIAKLRAFRRIWRQALEAFGRTDIETAIHARTSRWNKSVYDAHNNILRATTEAMSATIGGADSITVEPFDATYKTPGPASERLARNTLLILKHEAYLDKVADPAAGSYLIESLTDTLARAAWTLMQRIEQFGGFRKAYDSGMIPAEIAESRARKEAAIASGQRVFVGVNKFPDKSERMADRIEPHAGPGIRRGPAVVEEARLAGEAAQ